MIIRFRQQPRMAVLEHFLDLIAAAGKELSKNLIDFPVFRNERQHGGDEIA